MQVHIFTTLVNMYEVSTCHLASFALHGIKAIVFSDEDSSPPTRRSFSLDASPCASLLLTECIALRVTHLSSIQSPAHRSSFLEVSPCVLLILFQSIALYVAHLHSMAPLCALRTRIYAHHASPCALLIFRKALLLHIMHNPSYHDPS